MLLGLIPWLPAHEDLTKEGFELAGRIGTYALAGVVCKVGYDTVISTIQRAVKSKAETVSGSITTTISATSTTTRTGSPPSDAPADGSADDSKPPS